MLVPHLSLNWTLNILVWYQIIYKWYIHVYLTDEYQAKNEQNCQERDAYCARIGYTCICQCLSGYIMVNGHCLLGNRIFIKDSWM